MAEKTRTPKSWTHYLSDDDTQYTLAEYTAACLSLMLGHTMAMREAAEHTEGMLGAMDQFASMLAERMAIPYASSAKTRAALDERRDEQRRQVALDRQKELEEGEAA